MIAIINYDNEEVSQLKTMLKNEGLEENIFITDREDEILRSDKIILPDSSNIRSAIRMIQFHNFSSLLRMIKKPVLGINAGAAILCESISLDLSIGLGLFPLSVDCPNMVNREKSLPVNRNIEITNKTKLLFGIEKENRFYFDDRFIINISELTTSKYYYEGREVSASIENNNFYGVTFNPYKSEGPGLEVIKNFISI